MATPLPKRTAKNDAYISSLPYAQLTERQKQYADIHGLTLQPQLSRVAKGPMTPAERANQPGPVGGSQTSPMDPNVPVMGQAPVEVPAVDSAAEPPVTGPDKPAPTAAEIAAEMAKINAKEREEAERKARTDSYARLQTVLNDYGLGSLAETVKTWLVEGLSEAEIVQRMRETDQFKTRFPAIAERTKKGLAPISPGEYVAYERNARQLMRAAGLPQGYFDSNEDFSTFLVNDMSLSELGDRITISANAMFKMPKEDRDALVRWGMSPGDMTAFWLDPDKAQPLLERKYAAAQLAGAGSRTGFGSLDEDRATGLATLGVTEDQAQQGFGNLVQSRELFGALDRGEDQIGEDEQLGAVFGGNAAAQRRIENRRRRRQSQFESGGSFASGQTGVAGLGDTSG